MRKCDKKMFPFPLHFPYPDAHHALLEGSWHNLRQASLAYASKTTFTVPSAKSSSLCLRPLYELQHIPRSWGRQCFHNYKHLCVGLGRRHLEASQKQEFIQSRASVQTAVCFSGATCNRSSVGFLMNGNVMQKGKLNRKFLRPLLGRCHQHYTKANKLPIGLRSLNYVHLVF